MLSYKLFKGLAVVPTRSFMRVESMSVIIREGSLEEVVSVVEQINEFAQKESVASLAQRLSGKKSLILVAEEAGVLLGFKIGYE